MIYQDLTVMEGQHAVIVDTITNVNITGWTVAFYVKKTREDWEDPIITVNNTNGITMTDPSNGVMQISVNINLTPGTYNYDVWRVDSGVSTPLTVGRLYVQPRVPNS
jgi:hypothetical protein